MDKISISKDWAKSVSFTDFKKNSIIALLEPKRQHDLFEELTGKKVHIPKGKEE
jgi:hypothetical protein